MQDAGYRFPRTRLVGNLVNRGNGAAPYYSIGKQSGLALLVLLLVLLLLREENVAYGDVHLGDP
jgi:hypothetical protein